ncbi:ParB/RepB/Spo0J family partition protein [Novosphingobium sp. B1]|uniref:ParB/RepB/Spo0J family partition protein n=1 Tax=Novosphingobium sp. B1 TaxID=1938756 RepID=UPI0009D7E271|nr:ParB/RepB/Spo0J family partition protein [Novosphingobium sp. B1]SMD09490.1 chromosome partitioning protein, ParB family [Novosphingobium sp. B1]
MSGAGGKRRSLLANAIDSLGTTPQPIAEPENIANAREEERPAEEPVAPSFLERRGIAFDEIARAVKKLTIRLKPSECSIWPGNARDHAALNYGRCASLIESIREEGTNREPVVVRRTLNGNLPYELIVGTRRHFSVSWLNANHHPEIELIARIETLDDEAAFRLADLENREREDVTDLERARNYRSAVDTYYNGVRTQMAERLAIPKQNLHNLLQLAELPDEVVAAFADPGDLKVRHGMRLSPLLKDERYRDNIIAAASALAREQAELKAAGGLRIEGSKVCERLAAAAQRSPSPTPTKGRAKLIGASGKELGLVLSDTKAKGITLNINPAAPASVDEILEALRPVIEGARFGRA